jgi:hypothetical protein
MKISGEGAGGESAPITPRETEMYKSEYKEAVKLFQNALQEYEKSDNIYQQEEFRQVMDKAMVVLNEAARELKEKALLEKNKQIEKDFTAFNQAPTNTTAVDTLQRDLEKANRLI